MNIAYMATTKIPSREASSIHVMKICSALANANAHTFAAQGSSVTLIVPEYEKTQLEQGIENVFEYYGVAENFSLMRIKLRLPGISLFKGLRRSFKTARYACRNNFDRYYCRDVKACFFIAVFFRKPVFFEQHTSYKPGSNEDRYFRFLIKSRNFKKLIVITDALKRHFIEQYGLKDKQVYVAPDGADAPTDSPVLADLAVKSKGMFHVGYIGHLYRGRGLELLGDIAGVLQFAFFHIIGGKESDIAFWKEKYRGIDNIHFYGFVPPAQTAGYGKHMDVLIAPYQNRVLTAGSSAGSQGTAKWMSPLKIFEYMALGKPIVTSDIPVLKEVMRDGVNGILCPAEDADAWCDAIRRLYEDRGLSETLASNALKDFVKFTWDARARNLLELLGSRE